ncbi:MAG: GTPase ObgE [Kosmotoga sp.]|nr:MAG: GTPase ObgE [Kosmotoga sp.]
MAFENENLIDTAKIAVKAGRGGDGAVSFRREKYLPHGGPDGGDGGNGGHIFIRSTTTKNTLNEFIYKKHFNAGKGNNGKGAKMTGSNGEDVIIVVPVGTVIFDQKTGEQLADFEEPNQIICVARGGRGGRGNHHFADAVNQVPRIAEKGDPGERKILYMELKLLADVGIIGFPNVGKSTLISRISNAKPKIANYHFTTLVPNLGVVKVSAHTGYIVADVPGLIKGAHHGAGLGDTFLRHVERCSLLLHLVDLSQSEGREVLEDYFDIRNELKAHSKKLTEKNEIIVANKCDVLSEEEINTRTKELETKLEKNVIPISAVTGFNIDKLKNKILEKLKKEKSFYQRFRSDSFVEVEKPKVKPISRTIPEGDVIDITKNSKGYYVVEGPLLEYINEKFNVPDNKEEFILRKLEQHGLTEELKKKGIQEGDTVIINDREYEFKE